MAVAQEFHVAQELPAAQDDSQQLKRRFSSLSALSLGFVICNSWLGWSVNFMTPLNCGGGPGVVYGFLVATGIRPAHVWAGGAVISVPNQRGGSTLPPIWSRLREPGRLRRF